MLSLAGHKDSVNCVVGRAGDGAWLASGSDDESVRVWDLRTGRAVQRLGGVFQGAVTSVVASSAGEARLYASGPTAVFEFDLRRTDVLLNEASRVLGDDQEEINQVAVSTDRQHLAHCDDNGTVCVSDLGAFEVVLALEGAHDNIVSCLTFDPNASSNQLVTGGFDSQLIVWDITEGEVMHSTQIVAHADGASTASASQLLNPPFVHAMEFSRSGAELAVGLGDGTVAILDWVTTPGSPSIRSRQVLHAATVAHVHFPVFAPQTHLMTAGNDGRLAVFDIARDAATREVEGKGDAMVEQAKGGGDGGDGGSLLSMSMPHKVNWFTSVVGASGSNLVAVADTSPSVSVLEIQ